MEPFCLLLSNDELKYKITQTYYLSSGLNPIATKHIFVPQLQKKSK